MQAGEVALGMPVRLGRSGDIARIAKTTGHDFIFIDCQHSLFNLETIGHIASTALRLRHRCAGARARHRRSRRVAAARQRRHGHRLPGREQGRAGAQGGRHLQIRAARQALGHRRLSAIRLPFGAADGERAATQRQLSSGMHDRDRGRAGKRRSHRGGRRRRRDPSRQQRSARQYGQAGQVRRSGTGRGAGASHCRLPQARQIRRLRRQPRCGASGRSGPQGLPVPDHPVGYRLPVGGGLEMDRRHSARGSRPKARAAR